MKKLGFGMMRLPQKDDAIDIEQTKAMVDCFMKAGFTYFDTAFVYGNGASERAVKASLVDRYPRDSYTIATKLHAALIADDEASAKAEFYVSLDRLGVDYIDYYLLHALTKDNIHYYDDYHIWDFVKGLKEKGLVKHYGFSFHDQPEFLDELLTKHPDVDFVQLQLNYADWDNPSVASRRNYEVAVKHHKKVVVMEPVKGGTLAHPVKQVSDLLKNYHPDLSVPSWAIRFVASLDDVMVVLSGMSTLDQMKDNISYMEDFKPLDEDELKVIHQVQEIMNNLDSIPCTACHYCTPGCPMGIPIPEIFEAMNRKLLFDEPEKAKERYVQKTKDHALASACIQCGQCENACPQHLPIIEDLQRCAAEFE